MLAFILTLTSIWYLFRQQHIQILTFAKWRIFMDFDHITKQTLSVFINISRFSQIRELARFRVYGYLHGWAAVYKWGYASQYAHVHILICILVSRFSQISEEVFSRKDITIWYGNMHWWEQKFYEHKICIRIYERMHIFICMLLCRFGQIRELVITLKIQKGNKLFYIGLCIDEQQFMSDQTKQLLIFAINARKMHLIFTLSEKWKVIEPICKTVELTFWRFLIELAVLKDACNLLYGHFISL